jgi:hypothetical protein
VKSSLRFIVFGLLGLFALAACMPPDAPAEVERSEDAPGEALFTEDAALYPGTDLSLVENTGRPQFLNAFADW